MEPVEDDFDSDEYDTTEEEDSIGELSDFSEDDQVTPTIQDFIVPEPEGVLEGDEDWDPLGEVAESSDGGSELVPTEDLSSCPCSDDLEDEDDSVLCDTEGDDELVECGR